MSISWQKKIAALLHDPPDKALKIREHRERANQILGIALGSELVQELGKDPDMERPDWWASGADRINFPESVQVNWPQKPRLTHPLSGRRMNLGSLQTIDLEQTFNVIKEAVESLIASEKIDYKGEFMRLWRGLPEELTKKEQDTGMREGLGELWKALPADTRIPDHSIWQHNRAAAALAGALPRPAFLLFTIVPVQSFIRTARRLQDLWMGSYLLSWLMWQSLKYICDEYGPDSVIYPSLHGNPFVDLWLKQCGWLPEVSADRGQGLAIAVFPNRALVLLPKDKAEEAARKMEKKVASTWSCLADKVRQGLEDELGAGGSGWSALWSDQPRDYFKCYWAIYPWPVGARESDYGQLDNVITEYKKLVDVGGKWWFEEVADTFKTGGKYQLNVGTGYSLLYDLTVRGLESCKVVRRFSQRAEKGEKCTLCGERQALYRDGDDRHSTREFWKELADKIQQAADSSRSRLRGHYAAIKPGGQERLCTVCTIKRFVHPLVFSDQLNLRGGFPSTSTMAVARFKQKVIEHLSSPALNEALRSYIKGLEKLAFPKTVSSEAVPLLWRIASRDKLAQELLEYDGDAFFEETFTPKRLKEDFAITASEQSLKQARKALGEFLKECKKQGISPPGRYFAVLQMDGDNLGKWLAGTHDAMPLYKHILHPQAEQALSEGQGWKAVLAKKRLVTPSYHSFISDATASFALRLARFVIEGRYPGRLVYAGGDDLLALSPPECVLQMARELRALFSGEVKGQVKVASGGALQVDFGNPELSGYLVLDNMVFPTLGPRATASVGIAIAHHYQPLTTALSAAREALEKAKEVYGRNALCVTVLKRSGEKLCVGAKWFYTLRNDNHLLDSVDSFTQVHGLLTEDKLSTRFPYDLFREAVALGAVPLDGQKAELRRLWQRHMQAQEGSSKDMPAQMLLESLEKLLVSFSDEQSPAAKSMLGMVRLAEWLLTLSFLSRGGE